MPRKCSVIGCKSNYASQKDVGKVTIYSFPSKADDLKLWLASLPNIIDPSKVTDNMGVCANHFSPDVPMIRRGRYFVPTRPPTIFYNVPQSSIPTPPSQLRVTTKASCDSRNSVEDELPQFIEMDKFGSLDEFTATVRSKLLMHSVVFSDKSFIVLSKVSKGPIHAFTLYCEIIVEDGKVRAVVCECYKYLKLVCHQLFKKNVIRCSSELDEMLRFVTEPSIHGQVTQKEEFICRQVDLLNTPRNSRLYNMDDLCLGISWCTRSRSLYSELRNYVQLPSLSTLTKITRTAKNTPDDVVFKHVFDKQEERRRSCILIIDEIYVKASLSYRGGVLFGYAADHPDKIATTLLGIMVKCLFGGPKFLAKLLPCSALTAQFQFTCVRDVIDYLEKCGGKVIAIINDNNRVNQSFFKLFQQVSPETPWIVNAVTDPSRHMFLLYDPVHLIKNVRNNWITEKTQTINFTSSAGDKLAKWSDLRELHQAESRSMLKLSKLTKATISPTNVEKQKVSLALNVFCDETDVALKTSTYRTDSWLSTAFFVNQVVKLWKLLNCKSPLQTARLRDLGGKRQKGLADPD